VSADWERGLESALIKDGGTQSKKKLQKALWLGQLK